MNDQIEVTQDSATQSTSAEKEQLLEKLKPLISEYLEETGAPDTSIEMLQNLNIAPIHVEGVMVGFWGMAFRKSGERNLCTIKAFFMRKEHRAKHMDQVTTELIDGLEKRGVNEIEIWATGAVQKWLEKRYGIKPKVFVTHNPLETFRRD